MVSCTHVASISPRQMQDLENCGLQQREQVQLQPPRPMPPIPRFGRRWLQGNSNHDPDANHGAGIYKNH